MATTPLYINEFLLEASGDTLVPLVLDPADTTDAGIISDAITTSTDWDGVVALGGYVNETSTSDRGVLAILKDDGTISSYAFLNDGVSYDLASKTNVKAIFGGGSGPQNTRSYGIGVCHHDETFELITTKGEHSAALRSVSRPSKMWSYNSRVIIACSDGSLVVNGKPGSDSYDFGKIAAVVNPVDFCDYAYVVQSDGTVRSLSQSVYSGKTGELDNYVASLTNVKSIDAIDDTCVVVFNNGTVSGFGPQYDSSIAAWTNVKKVRVAAYGQYSTDVNARLIVAALKNNGTLYYSKGTQPNDLSEVTTWTNIKEFLVYYTGSMIIGLKNDGTVVGAGLTGTIFETCTSWTGISSISMGASMLLGVKSDGTVNCLTNTTYQVVKDAVVALTGVKQISCTTRNTFQGCVFVWHTDDTFEQIITSKAGGRYSCLFPFAPMASLKKVIIRGTLIAGLRTDGKVVLYFNSTLNPESTTFGTVASWTNIQDIVVEPNGYAIFGLKSDGTVVGAKDGYYQAVKIGGQISESAYQAWTNVKKLALSYGVLVGLKTDGTCVATGYSTDNATAVTGWTDIVDIATAFIQGTTSYSYTFGVKSDGTVVGCGNAANSLITTVTGWTNVAKIFCDNSGSISGAIAIKKDKTVVSNLTDGVAGWTDIDHIIFDCHRIGITTNGTVKVISDSYAETAIGTQFNGISAICGFNQRMYGYDKESNAWSYINKSAYGSAMTRVLEPVKMLSSGYHFTTANSDLCLAIGADGTCAIGGDTTAAMVTAVNGWTGIVDGAIGQGVYVGVAGLKSDGTAVCVGSLQNGQSISVTGFADLVDLAISNQNTFGVKSDGAIVTTGDTNNNLYRTVINWTNIKQLETRSYYAVGLKKDGSVVCYVDSYASQAVYPPAVNDAVELFQGFFGCGVLRADGRAFFTGINPNLPNTPYRMEDWCNITKLALSQNHIVGLRSDGSVVATGLNTSGQCNVSGWFDIVDITCMAGCTIGLKRTGGLVFAGSNINSTAPVQKCFSADKIHFQYQSGVEIPYSVRRSKNNALGSNNVVFDLKLNKSTLGSGRFINILSGTTTATAQRGATLSGLIPKRSLSVSRVLNRLGVSYADIFHGRDVIFRRANGDVLATFSREVVLTAGKASQLDFLLSVPVGLVGDIYICHGAAYGTDFAQATSKLPSSRVGVMPANAAANPTPGVYWDYASLGETYEVFGADGLKVADAVQYIYSIDYLVSDGIKSGEVQSNINSALGSVGDGLKLGEARAHDATLGGSAADGVKGSELTFGNIIMPAASADNFYGGEHIDDRLNSQNIAQEVLNTTELDSTTCVMPVAGGDSLVAAEGGAGTLLVDKQTADGVAAADADSGNINATHALAETTLQHNVAGAVSSMTSAASDGVATQDADQYKVSVLMLGGDGIKGSDTVKTLATLFGAGIDSVSIADPGSGFIDATLAGAEAFTTTDGGVMGLLVERAASDALTGGDTPGGVLILPAVVSDTTKGADGNACAVSIPMTASDSVKTSDSLLSQAALVGACLDAVYQTDVGYTTLQAIGVCVDAWLNSDPTGGFVENTRAVSDGLGISDGNSVTNTAFAQVSDILKGSEALFSIYTGFLTAIDGFLAQDVVNLGNFYTLAAADGISNGEAMAVSAILLNALSEVVKNSDSQANSSILKGSAADGLKSSDSQLNNHTLLGVLYENMLTSEQLAPKVAYINTLMDGMRAADTTAGRLILTALQSDGFTGKELLTNYAQILVQLGEFAYCGGLSAGYKQFADIILSDGARVGDSSALYVAILLAAVDGLQISEELNTNAFSIYLEVVGEQLRASDANQTKLAASAVAADYLKSLDALLLSIGAAAVAQDCLSTSDTAKTALKVLALCGDFVFGADTALPYAIKLANAVESVTWSESGRVEAVIGVTAAEGVSVFEAATTILQATSVASDKLKTFEQTIIQGSHLGDGVCVVVEAVFDELRKLPVRHEFKLARNTEYDTIKPRNTGEFKVSSACITFKVRK